MKVLILVLALSVGFVEASNAQSILKKETKNIKPAKSSGLTFSKMVIERNDILFGSEEAFMFEFKNNSKIPAIIQEVQTSCGCTTAQKPEAPVQPRKKSQISVQYDTKRIGPFTKTITITSNVSEPIILTIKGTVLPETVRY
jgi:hypothetical protein